MVFGTETQVDTGIIVIVIRVQGPVTSSEMGVAMTDEQHRVGHRRPNPAHSVSQVDCGKF